MSESVKGNLKKTIIAGLNTSGDITDDEVLDAIDKRIGAYASKNYLTVPARLKLRKDIFNSIRRLDVLQDYLDDPDVTEIMVNGYDSIFAEKDGRIERVEVKFESEAGLEDIIQRIAGSVNRTVNLAHPIVDARLEDGSRVNVVLAPVSLGGSAVTIRKFRRDIMSMDRLVENESITEEAADFLKLMVKGHYNQVCTGGTGSGKTTLLNVLAEYIPKNERVITIEDSAELILRGVPNLVRLEARNANVEGKNSISIRELIKTALRMRPDRIIVGETRGGEAIDMLQSLNTGHCGMSTLHANSPEDMVSRLETMVLLGENIPIAAVRAQIASAIDIIIGVSRMRDSTRRVTSIYETDGVTDGVVNLHPLFIFKESGTEGGRIKGGLVKVGELKKNEKLKEFGLL